LIVFKGLIIYSTKLKNDERNGVTKSKIVVAKTTMKDFWAPFPSSTPAFLLHFVPQKELRSSRSAIVWRSYFVHNFC